MSGRPPDRVVVVGASVAGLTATETLRRAGFDGNITLIGAEQVLPYDRPPLSKRVLSGEWGDNEVLLRSADELRKLQVDLRLGRSATALSLAERELSLDDGDGLTYDALLIATGVRPRQPFDLDHEAVHQLRSLDDARRLRDRVTPGRRLVVVGAGLIGSEVAAVARARGAEVSVIDPLSAPLVRSVGMVAAQFLGDAHRSHGVDLRCDVAVDRIEVSLGELRGVRLDDGTLVPADDVLIAVGSVPNTDWLTGSGLGLDDGVLCDEFCSAAPGVFAAGDVARWRNPLFGTQMRIEHRTNAGEQAMAAARNLLRPVEERTSHAPVPYFWSDQYQYKVQVHGLLHDHDEEKLVHGDPTSGEFLVAFRRGQHLVGVVGVGQHPTVLRTWRQAIGARTTWLRARDSLMSG